MTAHFCRKSEMKKGVAVFAYFMLLVAPTVYAQGFAGVSATPTFAAGTLTGSEATVAPTANTLASYLQITNTNNTGGSGGQIQFGHTAGNPYATFGSSLTDGSSNGTGDLVWGIRAGSSGSVTERMRLTSSGGNLALAPTVGFTTGGITAPGSSVFGGSVVGGALQNTINTVQIINPLGKVAEASNTYSEDNTAGALASTIRAYHIAFNNHAATSKSLWNTYNETHVTKQAVVNQTFGEESTIYNRGSTVTTDPYTPNVVGATENFRVDCGEGTFNATITASSAGTTLSITAIGSGGTDPGQVVTGAGIAADTELVRQLNGNPQTGVGDWETSVANTVASEAMTLATDPKGCTVGFHLLNNGANYRHGIVIGSDALDTAAGRIAPALAMGQNQSVSWYSGASTEAWKIFSNATAASGTITLANSGTITLGSAASTDMVLNLNPATAGQNAYAQFLDAGGGKWQVGKLTNNSFFIQDLANAATAMTITSAGNTTLGESGKTTTVNGLAATNAALTTPAVTGGTASGLTGLAIRDTSAAFDVTLAGTSSTSLSAGRTLTLDMKNVAHTLAFNATANTITFPNTASYTLIGSGDTGTVTNTMLAGSIADSKLLTNVPVACGSTCTLGAANRNTYTRLDTAGGSVATLPGATGTGDTYRLYISVATTSAADKVLTNPTTNTIIGMAIGENAGTAKMFPGSAITAHSIQMPFTGSQPSGGFIGDTITCTDVASTIWKCDIVYQSGTTPTTPYSTATS